MDNRLKDKPRYKSRYQNELAEECTGKPINSIKKLARTYDVTFAEAIRMIIQGQGK